MSTKRVRLTQRTRRADDGSIPYPGTVNQPDRQFTPHEKYDNWVETVNHPLPDMRTEWKNNPRDEIGFGISQDQAAPPTVASVRTAASKAVKLAVLLLGDKVGEDVIERQARDFMSLGGKALDAALKRFAQSEKLYVAEDEDGDGKDQNKPNASKKKAEDEDDEEEPTASKKKAQDDEDEDEAEETTAAEEDEDEAEETTAAEEDEDEAEETTAAEEDEDEAEETTAAEEDEDEAEETTAAEEDEDEEEPTASKKKAQDDEDEDEEEPTASKKRAEDKAEDEEEPTASKKRAEDKAEDEEKAEEKAASKKKKAQGEDEEPVIVDGLEVEMTAPAQDQVELSAKEAAELGQIFAKDGEETVEDKDEDEGDGEESKAASRKAGVKKLGGQPKVASRDASPLDDISGIWVSAPDVNSLFR